MVGMISVLEVFGVASVVSVSEVFDVDMFSMLEVFVKKEESL